MAEKANTIKELQEAEVPRPATTAELIEYIDSLAERACGPGARPYALSMAAQAAFNYMAHRLGCSLYEMGFADLDFLRRTRGIRGPFALLRAEEMLYPQGDLRENIARLMADWRPWLAERTIALLAEAGPTAGRDIERHWRKLAGAVDRSQAVADRKKRASGDRD